MRDVGAHTPDLTFARLPICRVVTLGYDEDVVPVAAEAGIVAGPAKEEVGVGVELRDADEFEVLGELDLQYTGFCRVVSCRVGGGVRTDPRERPEFPN
jgi:hypothetical protein